MDKLNLFISNDKYVINKDFDFNYKLTQLYENGILQAPTKKPYKNLDKLNLDINGYGLLIKSNPNKYFGKNYGSVIDCTQLNEFLGYTENELLQAGIETKIENAKVTRIDNNFDLFTDKQHIEYLSIIKNLVPIMQNSKQFGIENSMYFGNGSTQIMVYDKTFELRKKQKIVIPENVTRFELRHLKYSQKPFIGSLLSEKGFNQQRRSDKELIIKNLFNRNPAIVETEIISYFMELISSDMTASRIIKEIYRHSVLLGMEKSGISYNDLRSQHPQRSDYKKYNTFIKLLKELGKITPFKNTYLLEMYNELREKFLKTA